MVVFIAGASHTGKTCLAQRLLEERGWPYLSIDHLKMGLIRSGYTDLTVEDDDALTALMWPILREMAKTAIENAQNLVIEGCYLPFDWRKDFTEDDLPHIRFLCLAMTENYIRQHGEDIRRFASAVEQRGEEALDLARLLRDNLRVMEAARQPGVELLLIDGCYDVKFTVP